MFVLCFLLRFVMISVEHAAGRRFKLDIGMSISLTVFHLIRYDYEYRNEKLTWKLQLAWKKELEVKRRQRNTEKTEKATRKQGGNLKQEFSEKISSEAERSSPKPVPKSVSQFGLVQKETEEKTTVYMAEDEKTQTKESLFDRIDSFFEKTEYKFEEFCDKIEELIRKKELVAIFWRQRNTGRLFERVFLNLKECCFA